MQNSTHKMKTIATTLMAVIAIASVSACNVDTSATSGKQSHHHAKSTPKYSVAQDQAISSAQSYLSMSGFSRAGLLRQLTSKAGEGFKMADAVFAINHLDVDWNKEAVQSAKTYLEMGGFSRASLIQQLSSKAGDGYTVAQATYAANHVGL